MSTDSRFKMTEDEIHLFDSTVEFVDKVCPHLRDNIRTTVIARIYDEMRSAKRTEGK
jgi:hypothetical protein